MAVDIDTLQIEIEASSNEAVRGIDRLAASLEKLRSAAKGGAGLTATTNQMKKLAEASKILNSVNLGGGKIAQLAQALNSLSSVQKATGLTSTLNALKKLPAITEQLEAADLGRFAAQMDRVTSAVRPLATEMQKVSSGFAAFPIRIQKIIASNSGLAASNSKAGKSFNVFGAGLTGAISKLTIFGFGLRQLSSVMSNWVTESNKYVEDLNLFTVAMGDGAKEAYSYAQAVHEALGIDPAEWMRNQGVFKQITSGFGVVEDRANLMSKNLTQIGYDISSFFNISIAESMQKVQSGIAGELEPLRRLGYALDVATLQEIAYKNGIYMKVNAMNQAQKSQLRYLAIMEQSGNVMGDMARTIMTPANAMRVLQQQITQLTRALGNLLIPFLIKVIPYVQAFVEVLTEAIQRLAVMVGFELPEIDYSGFEGISGGASDAENAMDGATKAAKELKNAVLGIDELNILAPQKGSTGSIGGTDLGINLPEYDFLKGLQIKTKEIKKQMEEILDVVLKIGAGMLSWKITTSLMGAVSSLKGSLVDMKALKLGAGIVLAVTGFSLEFSGFQNIGSGEADVFDYLKAGGGAILGAAGVKLIAGLLGVSGPVGWVIGIGASLLVAITGLKVGIDKAAVERDMKDRFGELELTDEQIAEWAGTLTTSELTMKLDVFVDEQATLDSLKGKVESAITELDKYNFRVMLGIDIDEGSYKAAVDSYVSNAQEYIQQKQVVATMAIDILLGGTETGDELTTFASGFYSESSGKLEELGRSLKDVVADGFKDGKWIPDKFEAAMELQKQIQEVLDYISTVEFDAKLTALRLDAKGTDLTVESFQGVLDQAQDTIQGQMNNLEDVRLESLKVAKMEFDQNILNGMSEAAAQQIYDSTVTEIQMAFTNKSVELNTETFDFGIDTLKDAFSTELSQAEPVFAASVSDTLSEVFKDSMKNGAYDLDGDVSYFVNDVVKMVNLQLGEMDMTPAAKKSLNKLLEALKPTEENLNELAEAARSAGETVPAYVAQGLNDINQLKAIGENTDAVLYTVGQKFSTDPKFFDMLATVKGAGFEIDSQMAEGLLNNTEIIQDAANGTVTIINDAIGTKTLEVTPELVENLKDLGVNISDGLLSGAEDQMQANKKSWTDWAWLPWNWFKKENEINSPSKTFKELGGYLSDGLVDGINGKKSNLFSEVGSWAQSIVDNVKKKFEIHSPSALFRDEIGMNLGLGIAEGLSDSVRPIVREANSLADSITGAFDGMAFNIPAKLDANFKMPTVPNHASFTNGESARRIVRSIGHRTAVSGDSQRGFSNSVADGNSDVVNAVFAMASMVVQAIESKDTNIYLDKQRVGRALNETQKQLSREAGASFVKRGV